MSILTVTLALAEVGEALLVLASIALPVSLIIAASVHFVGTSRLARSGHRVASRGTFFYAGLLLMGIAVMPPLDRLAHEVFAWHMIQHLILMIFAPLLLVVAKSRVVLSMGLPIGLRRRVSRIIGANLARRARQRITHPLTVWMFGTLSLWGWHLPSAYRAALDHFVLHLLEHSTFLAAGLLFWNLVIGTARRQSSTGAALLVVFATSMQSAALGAILALSPVVLYPENSPAASSWGITALTDQQIGGALMWIPTGFVYLATMGILFLRLINARGVVRHNPAAGVR